jgi:multisubunit Na+/H+ antiporter MnhC subunit
MDVLYNIGFASIVGIGAYLILQWALTRLIDLFRSALHLDKGQL